MKTTRLYKPDKKCIESKSLKLYLFSFRNYGGFAEEIVNRILDDCVKTSNPKEAKITGCFTARGGITIKVEAVYNNKGDRKQGMGNQLNIKGGIGKIT